MRESGQDLQQTYAGASQQFAGAQPAILLRQDSGQTVCRIAPFGQDSSHFLHKPAPREIDLLR